MGNKGGVVVGGVGGGRYRGWGDRGMGGGQRMEVQSQVGGFTAAPELVRRGVCCVGKVCGYWNEVGMEN